MPPQQGLMGEGLLDLARHPVVGVNHALGHGLMDLQRLPGHQGCDVLVLVQLGSYLGRRKVSNTCATTLCGGSALAWSNLHPFQLQRPPSLPVGTQASGHLSQRLQSPA